MKTFGSKYLTKSNRAFISIGYSLNGIRLGFNITRHGIDIDLLFIWVSVEL